MSFTEEETPIEEEMYNLHIEQPTVKQVIQRRVSTRSSPHMQCFYEQFPAAVCFDCGAEPSLISEKFAIRAGIQILPTKFYQPIKERPNFIAFLLNYIKKHNSDLNVGFAKDL